MATSCIPDESYIPTFAINSGHTVHNGPAIHYLKAFGGTDAYKLCRHLNDADFCGRGPREAFIIRSKKSALEFYFYLISLSIEAKWHFFPFSNFNLSNYDLNQKLFVILGQFYQMLLGIKL